MSNHIGVIGGSGLYEMEGIENIEEISVSTPFGDPSDKIIKGELSGKTVFFLSRHSRGHKFTPSEVNYRANVYAMKKLGVSKIISISAIGSMKKAIKPGDIVLVDQFIDRTVKRQSTFFGNGLVAHAVFADPVCNNLRKIVANASRKAEASFHDGGTYVCIEGPQFSSRAESNLYRSWGVDVIGMTNATEAKLAREAEICFTTIALATDYDCWHETEEDVSVEAILEVIRKNVSMAKKILGLAIEKIDEKVICPCNEIMKYSIMTQKDCIPKKTKKDLEIIVGKYISEMTN